MVVPTFRPSIKSNGMAESFVKGFKRDYVYFNEARDADAVMAKLAAWFHDDNHIRPHKALKIMSPIGYQQQVA